MPTTTQPGRWTETRTYGRSRDVLPLPNLTDIQTNFYRDFLQLETPPEKRAMMGLHAIITEAFPISSFDGSLVLEYLGYDLGKPRYTPDECRSLRLTYGISFKLRLRLTKPNETTEESVYLGELPLMIGGGEFIINGAERVIVTQLHRSPGIDFSVDIGPGEKKLHTCWIIPERGSWIELSVTKKDALQIRIDQSGKFPAMTFFRAMFTRDQKGKKSVDFSSNEEIVRLFYNTTVVKLTGPKSLEKIKGTYAVSAVVDEESGEELLEAGALIASQEKAEQILAAGIKRLEVIERLEDPLILNSLLEDPSAVPRAPEFTPHDDALLRIYQRLRPGSPANIEKAEQLFFDKFYDTARYKLGRVGRFRLNRKFGSNISEDVQSFTQQDLANAIVYILRLRGIYEPRRSSSKRGAGALPFTLGGAALAGEVTLDDIDHLGNRRVKTIDELTGDEMRKGFLKLKKNVQERMNGEQEGMTPRTLVNSKTVSSSVNFFFGRGELSQVVDQTNPLSQLTHERRLSALGPGGLNRKRAGFEVRDVHISHYGRICPIETPEGTNIGLISSLAVYAGLDRYGFLTTPYRVVKNCKVTGEILWLRADQETTSVIAPADAELDKNHRFANDAVMARVGDEFAFVPAETVEYMDVAPKQLVGISASLIPFLEHDDANRALMGSNMQRQAVPLLQCEPPRVATGMEREVARNSGMVATAKHAGTVTYADATTIVVHHAEGDETHQLRKFVGLNERTCLSQQPIVHEGDKVTVGQVLADGAATKNGELALGKNVLVAFMPFDGYNFEDAILVSHALVRQDVYTSIHIDEFEVEIRETKLGREEFTREIPHVSEKARRNLDEDGVVRVGTKVQPGDILVGKVAPKSKAELTPEEKLLHAIFGKAGEDVKNESKEVPSGVEGIVIHTERFSRKATLSEDDRKKRKAEQKAAEEEFLEEYRKALRALIKELEDHAGGKLTYTTGKRVRLPGTDADEAQLKQFSITLTANNLALDKRKRDKAIDLLAAMRDRLEAAEEARFRRINKVMRGDELPTGVLEMRKVYVATKRALSVGDKFAGRHGNKGVVSKIMPIEDMPFLEDGTTIDMILNPLGVPSRMNVGQILETHLGWAAHHLAFQAVTPVFDGATSEDITQALVDAGLPVTGKTTLYDGRTGQAFDQKITVGYLYMLKLHHLVDDKVHARATGPYSLITQQPLGGKARFGGQRFGEMEVWALEAYGAANILQELCTVKSDDVEGRTKIYESMVKGTNVLEAGTPISFEVLCNEIRGLALNIELSSRNVRGALGGGAVETRSSSSSLF